MNKRLECNISGRVQMVMFRDFTQRNAMRLGIAGEVWNNSDGTVSVIAEGQEAALKELCRLLHKGPTFAQVESVKTQWSDEPTGEYNTFSIIYR